ncbi:acyltransferase [Microcella daejeonensis]|uniref:acyltransferase family protein n=1 Tax=Microcella daejeonensis TaxID=2994971 RepID=UPI00226F455E|nr:acyltransferase [Microcella daejeonensis]WAB84595.1 acyltransferase [Microcella daejeonensis]
MLRLLAAALVIIGHAWPLSGEAGVPEYAGIRIHHLGVYVFFAISGYLLASSWARDPSPGPFLIRRAFRILPGLIAVVVITTVALGPLLTTLPPSQYWSSSETWRYLVNITLFAQYELPGVFAGNPETAVNGSLWSLGVEVTCYLALVVAGLLGARAGPLVRALIAITIASITIAAPLDGAIRITTVAIVFFFLGSLLARGGVLAATPIWPGLVLAVAIAPLTGDLGTIAAWIVVTYLVVSVGSRPSRLAGVVRRGGDPSYGMYLWGFPLQQTVIVVVDPPSVIVSIVIVLPLAVAFGYLSWHLIERHAIRSGADVARKVRERSASGHGGDNPAAEVRAETSS